jgi:hypothetical protein
MVDWLTLIFAAVAAAGSLVRVAQNERAYRLMLKAHKRTRTKKK